MENKLYEYSPLISRKPFKLPNDARVAVWIGINVEYFDIGSADFGGVGAFKVAPPNVHDYAIRDYGNRIGLWRFASILDKYNIRASVLLNSDVCSHFPIIIDELKKRNWEFLGHGTSNSILLGGKTEVEERQIIKTALDTITSAVGKRPLGWLGPALQETFNTPDILAGEGIKYLLDWVCDEQPFPMKVRTGSLISIPYSIDLNDITAFIMRNMTPQQFCEIIKDQFDVLYAEGSSQARVMCIALHPFLIGQPFRSVWLEKALEYLKGHKKVWFATSGEIAAWYYEQYLGTKL